MSSLIMIGSPQAIWLPPLKILQVPIGLDVLFSRHHFCVRWRRPTYTAVTTKTLQIMVLLFGPTETVYLSRNIVVFSSVPQRQFICPSLGCCKNLPGHCSTLFNSQLRVEQFSIQCRGTHIKNGLSTTSKDCRSFQAKHFVSFGLGTNWVDNTAILSWLIYRFRASQIYD